MCSAEGGPADCQGQDGYPLLVGLGGAPLAGEAHGADRQSRPRYGSCFEVRRKL